MALITCKECSREYSDSVSKCPHCGKAKPANPASVVIGLIILAALFFFAKSCCNEISEAPSNSRPKTTEELIQSQFSAWDGSHKKLEDMIKATLNDPDSYEHDATIYTTNKDGSIRVHTQFRAKNAFGGTIRKEAVADFTVQGDYIKTVKGFD